ncbi:S-formylglutathione hydrolase, partial [Nannochloropsis gaditana CCMP526]|uniref:S-formylglutathione hydrolase n=1 Tax=Nannochloropsis gaditana (strain CCMP526) TaxID=1093141 RepID=UPI00029F75FD
MSNVDASDSAAQGLTRLNRWKACGGFFEQYTHPSSSTNTVMRFTVYFPPQSAHKPVPVLYFLSGLTCTDENVVQKGFVQSQAAKRGLAVVCPDTSPRGAGVDGEDESWDFGTGAGFYVDATASKWSRHYNMFTYVTQELPAILHRHFPTALLPDARSICGHSMGGHGALVCAMKTFLSQGGPPYKSVSAFAPIAHPTACPWGQKAFGGYLEGDQGAGNAGEGWDATLLMEREGPFPFPLLVDQGTADTFLEGQLMPEALEKACASKGQDATIRRQDGYDHSYFFISTFMADHIDFHANALGLPRE